MSHGMYGSGDCSKNIYITLFISKDRIVNIIEMNMKVDGQLSSGFADLLVEERAFMR